MKHLITGAVIIVLAATGAVLNMSYQHETTPQLTPVEIANIEALTQGEIYVEYDKNCYNGGKQVCVPNPFQIIYDQYIKK